LGEGRVRGFKRIFRHFLTNSLFHTLYFTLHPLDSTPLLYQARAETYKNRCKNAVGNCPKVR
jgi:hypothetical protein